MFWQPIETAPKDGRCVLLLSKRDVVTMGDELVHQPPKCAIGKWDIEGTSWCDQYGRYLDDPEVDDDSVTLYETGFWSSGGGWFQPNEVTHWMPIPEPGETSDIVDAACDLVVLWENQKIAGLPRAERNAAIEVTRQRLIDAVRATER